MERRSDRPRIADVAREAGVSKTAVSFAFNSPERLSAATAIRIRDVAASLKAGDIVDVAIEDADEHDLFGVVTG